MTPHAIDLLAHARNEIVDIAAELAYQLKARQQASSRHFGACTRTSWDGHDLNSFQRDWCRFRPAPVDICPACSRYVEHRALKQRLRRKRISLEKQLIGAVAVLETLEAQDA